MHQHEICHRDLKPENLLLKETRKGWLIKIVDFGLSNTFEGGKLLSTACGSPCYAAPEMIAGKKYEGPKIDIWSMGVILFTLVCGYLPFEDANTGVLYKKILACSFSLPKWLSSQLKDLIKRILTVDPRRRYSINDIRRHAWFLTVSDSEIPHDDLLLQDDESIHIETMSALKEAGIECADVTRALASKAYCPLTASYFLMKQKLCSAEVQVAETQSITPIISPDHIDSIISTEVSDPTCTILNPIRIPDPAPDSDTCPEQISISVLTTTKSSCPDQTPIDTVVIELIQEVVESLDLSDLAIQSDSLTDKIKVPVSSTTESTTVILSEQKEVEIQNTAVPVATEKAIDNGNEAYDKTDVIPSASTTSITMTLIEEIAEVATNISECNDLLDVIEILQQTETISIEPLTSSMPDESVVPLLTQDSIIDLIAPANSPVLPIIEELLDAVEDNEVFDIVGTGENIGVEVDADVDVDVEPFFELAAHEPETFDAVAQQTGELSIKLSVKERLISVRVDSARNSVRHRFGALPKLVGALPSRKSPRVQPLSLAAITASLDRTADSTVSVSLMDDVSALTASPQKESVNFKMFTPRNTTNNVSSLLQEPTQHSPRPRPSISALVCKAPDIALRSSTRPPVRGVGRSVGPPPYEVMSRDKR